MVLKVFRVSELFLVILEEIFEYHRLHLATRDWMLLFTDCVFVCCNMCIQRVFCLSVRSLLLWWLKINLPKLKVPLIDCREKRCGRGRIPRESSVESTNNKKRIAFRYRWVLILSYFITFLNILLRTYAAESKLMAVWIFSLKACQYQFAIDRIVERLVLPPGTRITMVVLSVYKYFHKKISLKK